jgi:hypothetical protein
MKSKNVFYVIIMLCVSAGFLRAQDSVPLPPGYGGGQDSVPPPPGYGGRMGMVPVEQDEFSSIVGARCLLKVSCDPSILRLDYTTMKYLWRSTGVLNKAYRDVLQDSNSLSGLDADSSHILLVDSSRAPAEVMYAVAVPDMAMGGKEKTILTVAIDNLKSALSGMGDEERKRLRDQLAQTEQRCEEMEKQVAEMQVKIRSFTQLGVTSQKEIQEKISGLRNSLDDAEMRLQYSDIRINDLRKQKEELQLAIEKSLAADTITEELKNIVKGAEDSLAMIEKMFSTGQTPADKIQEAKEKLARARIELARRMEEVRRNAGQDQLADIDGKIAVVNSQVSELRLGREFKDQEYRDKRDMLVNSDALELLTMKLDAAKKSYYEMLGLRENLKNRLQMQQPLSVSVIGMD